MIIGNEEMIYVLVGLSFYVVGGIIYYNDTEIFRGLPNRIMKIKESTKEKHPQILNTVFRFVILVAFAVLGLYLVPLCDKYCSQYFLTKSFITTKDSKNVVDIRLKLLILGLPTAVVLWAFRNYDKKIDHKNAKDNENRFLISLEKEDKYRIIEILVTQIDDLLKKERTTSFKIIGYKAFKDVRSTYTLLEVFNGSLWREVQKFERPEREFIDSKFPYPKDNDKFLKTVTVQVEKGVGNYILFRKLEIYSELIMKISHLFKLLSAYKKLVSGDDTVSKFFIYKYGYIIAGLPADSAIFDYSP